MARCHASASVPLARTHLLFRRGERIYDESLSLQNDWCEQRLARRHGRLAALRRFARTILIRGGWGTLSMVFLFVVAGCVASGRDHLEGIGPDRVLTAVCCAIEGLGLCQ